MKGLHWFRADLRLDDNTALIRAVKECDALHAIFFITPGAWADHGESPNKISFILKQLRALSEELHHYGIQLFAPVVDTFDEIPGYLSRFCKEHSIDKLYFNKQYEFNEVRRDLAVVKKIVADKIVCSEFDDALIVAPGALLNQQGSFFKVFTPFKKAWWDKTLREGLWCAEAFPKKKFSTIKSSFVLTLPKTILSTSVSLEAWPAGKTLINDRMSSFFNDRVKHYAERRDIPSIQGTSQLSPYLSIGAISPRQAIAHLLECIGGTVDALESTTGPGVWVSELIWREFYTHIMFHCPRVCYFKPYKLSTDQLPWRHDASLFDAWCQGRTGFPLVDAAMRQLVSTGWMHNRLRMVTAMFLTKTMFIDWRWGEAFFMKHLIDGNLAANNGGWQWCASTGTDAVPYFRIFNPTTQSQRFDPEGNFIRHYCPELAGLDNKDIHAPFDAKRPARGLAYPAPVVDYKAMRETVINLFKQRSLDE